MTKYLLLALWPISGLLALKFLFWREKETRPIETYSDLLLLVMFALGGACSWGVALFVWAGDTEITFKPRPFKLLNRIFGSKQP
jgi:hypothetical protein